MTREIFSQLASATARAQAQVRSMHCQPPTFMPPAPVRASIRCTKCGGLLNYTVSAVASRTTGRCSSAGCITWSDL